MYFIVDHDIKKMFSDSVCTEINGASSVKNVGHILIQVYVAILYKNHVLIFTMIFKVQS